MKWNIPEIALGLALISPIDEALVGTASGGLATPVLPLQGAASTVLGAVMILKGTNIIK